MMDYAMKSLGLLAPSSLSKCVTAAGSSVTQQLLSARPPRQKPFRVTNADRSVKKGIMAHTVEDLLNKTLPENAVLMVLEKGQKWTPHSNSPTTDQLSQCTPKHRTDVARVTFDLYKNNPKDFIGCLNVKATLYGAYSVSYDLRCYAAKRMLKEALRWTIFSMQATGHILLGSSCYIEQLLEEEERAENGLMLPQESRIKQLQGMLLGKVFIR